jgi:MYXO-CTERM domain-containing protein
MRLSTHAFVCAPLALVLAATVATARPDYVRSTNWVAGTTQGGTQNNPNPVGGLPVWQYETTQGGALGTANAWYKQSAELMTWDSAWYGTGWGVWSKGNDANPPVLPSRLVHNVAASVYNDVPLVRFQNPLGNGAAVSVNGSFQIAWNGVDGLGRPNDVDVVIAKYSAALNDTVLLYSTTVSKPLPFPSVGDSVNLPINLSGITLDQGDSIIISHRGRTPLSPLGAWINLYDNVTVSAVPAPGAAGLLGAAGMLAVRRRRK